MQVEKIHSLLAVQLLDILRTLDYCTVGLLWRMVCIPGNQLLTIIANCDRGWQRMEWCMLTQGFMKTHAKQWENTLKREE